jgi:tetratricopeptide (TPR) repeat protein
MDLSPDSQIIILGWYAHIFVLVIGSALTAISLLSAIQPVIDAYRRGDYEGALLAAEKCRGRTQDYCYFRGRMLMELGNLEEAEKWLHMSMVLAQGNSRRAKPDRLRRSALARGALGELYLEQRRFDEALNCFETSAKEWPEHGEFHRDLAEVWLRWGSRPAEALKLARLAVEKDRAGASVPQTTSEDIRALTTDARDTGLSEDLATLAWAVAVTSHDRQEVDRLIGEALPFGTQSVSPRAAVHYRSGLAYAALGEPGRSSYHFSEATRIDPLGRWGRAARLRSRRG